MSFINYISENILLPINDLITRQSVYRNLQFLKISQFWTREQIDTFQINKLRQLIMHSSSNIPYYKELFAKSGIKASDIQKLEDLRNIPILNKATFYNNGTNMFTSMEISRKEIMQRSSSGSTGEPLFYLSTKDSYSMNLAAILRGWYWMGYRLGDKYIKLSQNARKNPIKRLQDKMSRNLYLATNPMVDNNFEYILKEIELFRPKIIRCYPDPLLFLARYKLRHLEFGYKPMGITTTGNTLFPETRAEIEAAFGCKIFDAYNCEGNSVVFECPTHTCYHAAEEYGISEVLDINGKPIKSGVGRLISTDLWNFAHPFIRYDTQDLVEISDEVCSCGRKHLRINRIIGRENDVIVSQNERKFIVHNFTGFFQQDNDQLRRSIDQFQVIRNKTGLLFKLVVNSNFDDNVKEYIKIFWTNEFLEPVEVEIVKSIPISIGGKRKFIINAN